MNHWLIDFPDSLPTPCIAVDETRFRKSMERVLAYAKTHEFRCCPHFKAHKTTALTRIQIDYGCTHFCVAKAEEGLILKDLPISDLFCTCHPVGKARLQLLAEIARTLPLRVPVDCAAHLNALSDTARHFNVTFSIMLDIDLGLGRTGVREDSQLEPLLDLIQHDKRLTLAGVQLYPGHIWGPAIHDASTYDTINNRWLPCHERLTRRGFSNLIISVGSSPMLFQSHRIAHVNEIRPGALLMGDYWLLSEGALTIDECAVRVISSVVSVPEPGRALIDAGTKALCGRSIWGPNDRGFGFIDGYPDAKLFKLHEELGWINYLPERGDLVVGQRLSLLPVLSGPTISQHRSLYLKRSGNSEIQRIPVEGAGALC